MVVHEIDAFLTFSLLALFRDFCVVIFIKMTTCCL